MSRIDYGTLFVRAYTLMIALACGLGAVILTSGHERFSTPSFRGARDLVAWLPGEAHYYWGGLFLVYGLILIGALGRPIAVHALRFGMVIYLFFAITFFLSLLAESKAGLTGCVAYMTFFGFHAVLSDHLSHRSWTDC